MTTIDIDIAAFLKCIPVACVDKGNPKISGVWIECGKMVATDSRAMIVVFTAGVVKESVFISINSKTKDVLRCLKKAKVSHVSFTYDDFHPSGLGTLKCCEESFSLHWSKDFYNWRLCWPSKQDINSLTPTFALRTELLNLFGEEEDLIYTGFNDSNISGGYRPVVVRSSDRSIGKGRVDWIGLIMPLKIEEVAENYKTYDLMERLADATPF